MTQDDNTTNETAFEALPFIRKQVPQFSGIFYRVYTDATSYLRVEASSALEAIKKSGLQNIVRLERDTIYINSLIEIPAMIDEQATGEVMIENLSAEKSNVLPAVAGETGLSDSEVDKLVAGKATEPAENTATDGAA